MTQQATPEKPLRVVIVGGVAGGMSAATRLRRLHERAEIIVLERGDHVSFANCGLPYHLSDEIQDREKLLLHTPQSLAARFQLDVRVGHEVTALHPQRKAVTYTNLHTGESSELNYDKLILSPGAAPFRPNIPGVELGFVLRDIDDMDQLKEAIHSRGPQAVVVGAGFIGLEVAENLRKAGKEVTIVEMAWQVLPPLDPEMAGIVALELGQHGVRLHLGAAVESIQTEGVRLSDGSFLPAHLVVLAAGVRPSDELARAAGLSTDPKGGILVSESMQTSEPDIYAVGDATLTPDPLGRPTFVPLAWGANRAGRLVADHIMGRSIQFGRHPATAIAKVFDLAAASTGLNERQVKELGFEYSVIHTHPGSNAGYYPGAERISLKMIFNPSTGEIYGAQAVGKKGVDKQIDVLAIAITTRLSAPDLANLPLAYAPPFGSAKNPVNMLGYVAQNVMLGDSRPVQWHQVSGSDRLIVDVREDAEVREGIIPGARHIPLNELRDHLDELRGLKVLVYCAVGLRCYLGQRMLTQHGIDAVTLDGGYVTWRVAQTIHRRAIPTDSTPA